jgi:hypothetical protein
MPFRHTQPAQFGLDVLQLMQRAFDSVCAKLQIDVSDPRRGVLANEIVLLATSGERLALAELAEQKLVSLR